MRTIEWAGDSFDGVAKAQEAIAQSLLQDLDNRHFGCCTEIQDDGGFEEYQINITVTLTSVFLDSNSAEEQAAKKTRAERAKGE